MNMNINIDWTTILTYVGAAYLVLTAASAFFASLSAGLEKVWPSGAAFFASAAQICGTIAGALHTIPLKAVVRKSGAALMLLFVCGLGLGASACAGSLEEAKLAGRAYRPSVQHAGGMTPLDVNCVSIDRAHIAWDAVGKGAAAIAGAQGIVLIPLPDDNKGAKIGLAAGVVGATVVAVFSEVIAEGLAAEWARYCADPGQVSQ